MTDAATIEPRAKAAHVWARDPHDWYVEPEWVSKRLFEEESFEGGVLDPACGSGRIVRAAEAAGLVAFGTDLIEREGGCVGSWDFLSGDYPRELLMAEAYGPCENTVSNPPFKDAERFVRIALAITPRKVAMLLPISWLNGDKRSRWLETTPLRRVWIITPRPSMPPGAVIAAGHKPGQGTQDFAWFVFLRGYDGRPEIRWLRRTP